MALDATRLGNSIVANLQSALNLSLNETQLADTQKVWGAVASAVVSEIQGHLQIGIPSEGVVNSDATTGRTSGTTTMEGSAT